MPLPVAHALVGASVAAAIVSPSDPWRLQKIALGGLLAVAPDFDFFFVWILGWDYAWHRGFTHSMLFALAAGAATFLTLRFYSRTRDLWTYSLALMSHGFLDATFSVEGGGVELLWPFTDSRYRFGVSSLFEWDPTWIAVLTQCALEAVIFLPIFAAVLWLSRPRRP